MLGVLPGVIGTIQATEAIKLILGVGEPLVGRLLLYDAFTMRFRELKLRRDPECPVCGDHPTVRALIDYDQFCGMAPAAATAAPIPETTVQDLKARLDRGDACSCSTSASPTNTNLHRRLDADPAGRAAEAPRRTPAGPDAPDIVVHCKMGGRSAKAVRQLVDKGFTRVQNLKGGILSGSTASIPLNQILTTFTCLRKTGDQEDRRNRRNQVVVELGGLHNKRLAPQVQPYKLFLFLLLLLISCFRNR